MRTEPSDAIASSGPPESPKHTPWRPSPLIVTVVPRIEEIGSAVNSRSPLRPVSWRP